MADENELPEGEVLPEEKPEATISASQLKAILRSSNEKYERVANELAELKAAKEKPAPLETEKRFTKAELKAAVAAGQVTEEQSDALWEKQLTADVTARVEQTVLQKVGAQTSAQRVEADLADYKRLIPELKDRDSEQWKTVKDEFDYLMGIGQPKSLETELAALRSVHGPLEKLKVARSGRRETEYHEETGGGEGRSRSGKKSAVDGLTAREKDYYEGRIKSGQYKDWKEVEAELAYANPEVRRKAGARV